MARKLLIALLIFSLIVELAETLGAFFFTSQTFKLFGVNLNNDTVFLGYVVAWLLLFVSLIIAYGLWLILQHKDYPIICYLLGFWWLGIGIGIYLVFGKIDNLILDSLKGLLIVGSTYLSSKKSEWES